MKLALVIILTIWIIFDAFKVRKDIQAKPPVSDEKTALDLFAAFPVAVFLFVKKLVAKKK